MTTLAITPDGRHVISRSGAELSAWETCTGRLLRRDLGPLLGREYPDEVLADGRLLTYGPDVFVLRLRSMLTGKVEKRFPACHTHYGPPVSVPSPHGRFVAVHNEDKEIAVYDLRTGKCCYRLDGEAYQSVRLSDDGDVLVWCNGDKGQPWFGAANGKLKVVVRHHSSGKTLVLREVEQSETYKNTLGRQPCLSPDGRWLVLGDREGRLHRWDLRTGKELPALEGKLWNAWDFTWSPDSRLFAAHGFSAGPWRGGWTEPKATRLWDVSTGSLLPNLQLTDAPTLLCFSPDSRTVIAPNPRGVLHLWEVATGKERAVLRGHSVGGAGALALSVDGRMLVSGGRDSQVLVWDLTARMADGEWCTVSHSPAQLRAAWDGLASTDARTAYRAMWQLAADPRGASAFLGQRLRPVPHPEPGQITRLIADLDAEDYGERQRASRQLEELGEVAADSLQQTLESKPTLEVRRRVEALLARLRLPTGEQLQALRAVEALEHMGTGESAQVLRRLASGAPAARLTREARTAQDRLGKSEP